MRAALEYRVVERAVLRPEQVRRRLRMLELGQRSRLHHPLDRDGHALLGQGVEHLVCEFQRDAPPRLRRVRRMAERLGRQCPSAEHHELHPVHIGGAQHPADVLRPARAVQRERCESFRHRCLLPGFDPLASDLLAVPDSAVALPPAIRLHRGVRGSGFLCRRGLGSCLRLGLHRLERPRDGTTAALLEFSSVDSALRPAECSPSVPPAPCSSRSRVRARAAARSSSRTAPRGRGRPDPGLKGSHSTADSHRTSTG